MTLRIYAAYGVWQTPIYYIKKKGDYNDSLLNAKIACSETSQHATFYIYFKSKTII